MKEILTYTSTKEWTGLDDVLLTRQGSKFRFKNKEWIFFNVDITYSWRNYNVEIIEESKKGKVEWFSVSNKEELREKLVKFLSKEWFKEQTVTETYLESVEFEDLDDISHQKKENEILTPSSSVTKSSSFFTKSSKDYEELLRKKNYLKFWKNEEWVIFRTTSLWTKYKLGSLKKQKLIFTKDGKLKGSSELKNHFQLWTCFLEWKNWQKLLQFEFKTKFQPEKYTFSCEVIVTNLFELDNKNILQKDLWKDVLNDVSNLWVRLHNEFVREYNSNLQKIYTRPLSPYDEEYLLDELRKVIINSSKIQNLLAECNKKLSNFFEKRDSFILDIIKQNEVLSKYIWDLVE